MTLIPRSRLSLTVWGGTALLMTSPAFAHTGHGDASGFAHGFLHPILGPDHLLAMLAVGLWSGFVMPARLWAGAASFLAAMTLGAALNWAGLALPMVESAILASVLIFGLLVALTRSGQSATLNSASLLAIAGFAAAHGYAHAAEATGNAIGYLSGFLLATAALHLAGIALARRVAQSRAAGLVQAGLGGAIALGGLALMAA